MARLPGSTCLLFSIWVISFYLAQRPACADEVFFDATDSDVAEEAIIDGADLPDGDKSARSGGGLRGRAYGQGLGYGYGRKRGYTHSDRPSCVLRERRYVSSPLEQRWFNASARWKAEGNGDLRDITPYCQLLAETAPQIQKMLSYIAATMASNATLSLAPDADSVLSYFEITLECGPYTVRRKEHIESMVGGLRHPFCLKCPPNFKSLPSPTDIMDRSYVLLASRQGQFQGARRAFYLEAGAGIGFTANPDHTWIAGMYANRGIALDRAIFWEAQPESGTRPVGDIPPRLFPTFTFYNIFAPQDLEDPRNPLHTVTRLARPEDFVSVKLDVDHPDIEGRWIQAILGRTSESTGTRSVYANLIDELFWEHHFAFRPLIDCCWAQVDRASYLVDSMRIYIELRQAGIRAHYWQ